METLTVPISCVLLSFGIPVTNCEITITDVVAEMFSGGHDHDSAERPAGIVNPTTGNTGRDTSFPFEFQAPEVSGCALISGFSVSPDHPFVTFSGTVPVRVRIPGLQALTAGFDY